MAINYSKDPSVIMTHRSRAASILVPTLLAFVLSGCVTIHVTPRRDPQFEQRLAEAVARLEAELRVAAEAAPAAAETPAERVARIDEQTARATASLRQVSAKAALKPAPAKPAVAEAETPAPAAAVVAAAEAPAATEASVEATAPAEPELLVRPSAEVQAGSLGFIERRFGNSMLERFTTGTTAATNRQREDLLGKRLPQTRFLGPDGRIFNIQDFEGHRRVVLVVLRGFPGYVCVGCSTYTVALSRALEEFQSRNAQILLVYPGEPETVAAFLDGVRNVVADFELPFPVLLDVNRRFVQSVSIQGELAQPSTFIIDESGTVRYAYVGRSVDDRPPVPVVLEALDGLSAP